MPSEAATRRQSDDMLASAAPRRLLFVNPKHVRRDKLEPQGGGEGSGVSGDPTLASSEYGEKGLQLKVRAALRQIRELLAKR